MLDIGPPRAGLGLLGHEGLVPLSWAYGVSCRARAERDALHQGIWRFAPTTVGPPLPACGRRLSGIRVHHRSHAQISCTYGLITETAGKTVGCGSDGTSEHRPRPGGRAPRLRGGG